MQVNKSKCKYKHCFYNVHFFSFRLVCCCFIFCSRFYYMYVFFKKNSLGNGAFTVFGNVILLLNGVYNRKCTFKYNIFFLSFASRFEKEKQKKNLFFLRFCFYFLLYICLTNGFFALFSYFIFLYIYFVFIL